MDRRLVKRRGIGGRHRGRAFTLIELLVVIAIIALLLSIIMPALKKAREVAKQITGAAHQRGFGLAFVAYVDDNDGISHWAPNYGRWYVDGLSGEMLDQDDGQAYWGIAYYPYAENMKIFHCPSARRVDDWYEESAQNQYGWAHFGLNVFIANRIIPGIKLPSESIILQDHVESLLDNNGDMFFIKPGQQVNLPQWRFDLRVDYPEAVPECFRHNRVSWAVSAIPPHEPMGSGKSNTLWLDGHVSAIKQTTGEDVRARWYTTDLASADEGRAERWTAIGDAPE